MHEHDKSRTRPAPDRVPRWPTFAALALVLALTGPVAGLWAQNPDAAPRPMTIVDLIEVPTLGDPRISPDGTRLLFVRRDADWEENGTVAHIWRVDADGGNLIQVTNGENGETSPRWSPDGSRIAFLARRGEDEHTQIYLLNAMGGEANALTDHPTAVSSITWAPDGSGIYFVASDELSEEEQAARAGGDDVFAFDENYQQLHIWRASVEGGEASRVTEGDYSVTGYSLSRDGTHIAFHRGESPLFEGVDRREVWVMRADGSGARQLTRNSVPEYNARLSPDNQWVAFHADSNEDFDFYYNDNLFLVPASGDGEARVLLPDMPHGVDAIAWSGDGEAIFFRANTGVREELMRVDIEGERLTQLTQGDHQVINWQYAPALDAHVFGLNRADNRGDLWVMRGEDDPERVTRVFDYLTEDFVQPRQEAIRWQGEDGVEVEGLLFYPLDYEEGTRYPLVVQTHGGPAASDKFQFSTAGNFVQVLNGMGYFVFKPNYRGSTGYGDDFLRNMVGNYFDQAHLDVMTGVDHLIDLGLVDGARMAKMGWSAGGHMTNKIITHTGRFKAAASGAGAANWVSMYAQSDIRVYRTPWFGGTPWEEDAPVDQYWQDSPLREVWRVSTPTIFLVGEEDARVPMPQSVEMYRGLKHNGVPTHLYVAPRAGHGWTELRHQLFKANVHLEWFERWVHDREYEWEEAPGDEEEARATTAAEGSPRSW